MNRLIAIFSRLYRDAMGDSLRRNSSFLIISQAINAGTTFIFWIICARLFPAHTVGLATAFIALGGLVAAFTNLGLPSTIIRFLPLSKNKAATLNASLLLVILTSLVSAALVTIIIGAISPKLSFVQHSATSIFILLLLIIATTTNPLADSVLMAFKRGDYVLKKALISNIPKLFLPFALVGFAFNGIVGLWTFLLLVGVLYTFYTVGKKLVGNQTRTPDFEVLKNNKTYALSNYLGGMLGIMPSTLVPIIVLNTLGATQAAYFYMPMQIAAFLGIIASSTSQALISETSQDEDEAKHAAHFKNAFKHMYKLLLPAIVVIALISWPLLKIYGAKYAEFGLVPLLILAGASVFVAVNWMGDTLLNIQKRPVAFFMMNGINAGAVLAGAYLLSSHGLIGVALGWLAGQVFSALVYLAIFARSHLLFIRTV